MDEVCRSKLMFFSGGGVTLTGGEATIQFAEVKEFLTALKGQGVSTCMETNGIHRRLPELFPVLDHLIMDIKHYDPQKHGEVTGLPNTITIENVKRALDLGQDLALRIPLIGGFNASEADARGFVRLFSDLGVAEKATVELLPYHEYGKCKYASLGMEYAMTEGAFIKQDQLARFRKILESSGIKLIKT